MSVTNEEIIKVLEYAKAAMLGKTSEEQHKISENLSYALSALAQIRDLKNYHDKSDAMKIAKNAIDHSS